MLHRTGRGAYDKEYIINELKKPGLEYAAKHRHLNFANIYSIDDVKIGMEVPGVVTNITRFGAFIDIGVKQDNLWCMCLKFRILILPTPAKY